MSGYGGFGYGMGAESAQMQKMLISAKAIQVQSDVSAITPVWKDPGILDSVKVRTPFLEELKKVHTPESTYRKETNSADTFGKFTAETNGASRFDAQKGSYAEATYACKLMTYKMQMGMFAQKNVAQPGSPFDLVREEQKTAMLAMRKGIERCIIQGAPAGATDGGVTDALAFSGLTSEITTNVDNPGSAEAISLDKMDAQMNALNDKGIPNEQQIIMTDAYTATKVSALFYNTFNTPITTGTVKAGVQVSHYNGAPIFWSSYMPTGADVRQMYFIDRESTVMANFWDISQIELGRTELSDDSLMFWMGTLAVTKEDFNAVIKKILS